jgi:hypothetical protein
MLILHLLSEMDSCQRIILSQYLIFLLSKHYIFHLKYLQMSIHFVCKHYLYYRNKKSVKVYILHYKKYNLSKELSSHHIYIKNINQFLHYKSYILNKNISLLHMKRLYTGLYDLLLDKNLS